MVKNIAHRGFSGKYPENTMLAFEKAIEAGCDGIELDVQLSKDGIPVIVHDERLARTTGESGYVWDYTLDELKKMNAAANFGTKGLRKKESLEIPTLEEYLALVKGKKDFLTNIELKTGVNPYAGIEEKVLELLHSYHMKKKVLISSFNHYSIKYMKQLDLKIKCGLLESSRIVGMAKYAKRLKANALHPFYPTVTVSYMAKAKAHGLDVNVWTVDEPEEMQNMLKLGVNGIITNYPDRLKQEIENSEIQIGKTVENNA